MKPHVIHIDELSDWYSQMSTRELDTFRREARKLFDKIEQTFELMKSTSEKLGEEYTGSSESASDKVHETAIKCANRFSSSIKEAVKEINFPEKIEYSHLNEINDKLTDLMKTIHESGRRYVPPISKAKLYKREITELHFFLKDLIKSQKKLDQIVQEYDHIKIIEQNFDKITELRKLIERLSELALLRSQCEGMHKEVESNKNELINRKESCEKEESFVIINQINEKIKKKQMELIQALQVLDKPFKKFKKSIDDGIYVPSEETAPLKEALEGYIVDLFTTFTSEKLGYPILKTLVKEIRNLMELDRLEIKQKLLPKIKAKIDKLMLDDSLLSLQKELKALLKKKEEIMHASGDLFAVQDKLNAELQELTKKESGIQIELSKILAEISWCKDKLNALKKALETNFSKELEEEITISTDSVRDSKKK